MPKCDALGIAGRDDAGPQIPKARAHRVKVPSSSGEEEEASESKAESVENSEVEYALSTEDRNDGDDDDDQSDGDDEESEGDDAGEAIGNEEEEAEEKASSPHRVEGPAMVPSPELSPRAPPEVGEESGPVGMEVDDGAFVIAPDRKSVV